MAALGEAYREFRHVPAAADNYAGQPCDKHQNDMIHRMRDAEHSAFRAIERFLRASRMSADDLYAIMRQE